MHPAQMDTRVDAPFAGPVGRLIEPFLERFARQLESIPGLSVDERSIVDKAARSALENTLQLKLNRLLLLELNAAALAGALPGSDPRERWDAFLGWASSASFDAQLRGRYPTLHDRVAAVCTRQAGAVLTLASRLAADRAALAALPQEPHGTLVGLVLGAGDSHRGGQSVARLELTHGTVMYKPRPLQIDVQLERLLMAVLGPSRDTRIRVPQVLVRDGYGWAEFVAHRYCDGDDELRSFYRNLGHWLAILQLVGGTDMHSENVVACGPTPMVVDLESVFTPEVDVRPSGRGQAVDVASRAIRATALRTGLLPLRAKGFALAGVDISGAGALSGQQPSVPFPTMVGIGTDTARMAMSTASLPLARNQPSSSPVLERYWGQIEAGFLELTARLHALDRAQRLEPLLRAFVGCEVRRIHRGTQAYTEIGRMLWHPASLHDPAAAVARAHDILRRHADALPGAPRERDVIQGEIDDLLAGDVPVFTVRVDAAQVNQTLDAWRSADLVLEALTIRGALVSAYLNEGDLPPRDRQPSRQPSTASLDARRRRLAATLVRELCDSGVRGSDGSLTWISPVLTEVGWVIRPLTADLYTGQGGVAVCLASYLHEMRVGHADAVEGLEAALHGTLHVLRATEDLAPTPMIGGFMGVASQVWTWSVLHDLLGHDELLARARQRAEALTERLQADNRHIEVLGGIAGAIVPLLGLAEKTGETRWHEAALLAAERVQRAACHTERGVYWPSPTFPEGMGGFAHGATGIGWALARLALSGAGDTARRQASAELAERAFAYEESLYRPEDGAWADVRKGDIPGYAHAWCHGSMGIGLAAADLYRRGGDLRQRDVLRRACAAATRYGFGWSHTLCHGDLGLWELLDTSRRVDPEGYPVEREAIDAEIVTGVEERGPVGGLAREAFTPGLMPGLGGVVLVLLRMHPQARLASPLLLGRVGE